MHKDFLVALLSAYFFASMLALVYFFPTPRHWVVMALSQKEAQTAAVAYTTPSDTNTPTPPSDISATSSAAVDTTDQPKTYQYKIVESVDPCTLNKLGADGWHAIQFGGTLILSGGKDETCKKTAIYNSLDWALFEK